MSPETRIDYTLEQGGPVSLKIYDVAGRLVRTIVDGEATAGKYSELWNGQDYQSYLECLSDARGKYHIDVHSYVLMTNHVRLLVMSYARC